jgi:hypothetical protein
MQRFVDTIIDGRVNVMQVVPSYLEVVLSIWNASRGGCPSCAVCR